MQLTNYENITKENILFNKTKEYKVKESNIKYKRIKIEVNYPNGKRGPLVVVTPLLFSFGVSENKDQRTGKLMVTQFLYVFGKKMVYQTKKNYHFLKL